MTDSDHERRRNRSLSERHFEEFVNQRDLDAIDRNMAANFLDHDGPSGGAADRVADRAMLAAMDLQFPDLRIELKDILAEGDKVAVRAIWRETHAKTGRRMEMHGFVLWRIADGLIIERWATTTPMGDAERPRSAW